MKQRILRVVSLGEENTYVLPAIISPDRIKDLVVKGALAARHCTISEHDYMEKYLNRQLSRHDEVKLWEIGDELRDPFLDLVATIEEKEVISHEIAKNYLSRE